jgi:hypothetical protein
MGKFNVDKAMAEFHLLGETDPAAVRKLLLAAFDADGNRTRVPWKGQGSLTQLSGIGYNRGWLLVERVNMLVHEPGALVDLAKLVQVAKAEWNALPEPKPEFDSQLVMANVVRACMLEQHDSWGRVMVRCNITEGYARKLFGYKSRVQDLGLRPAMKGGRFLQDQGNLYTEQRQREGAAIAHGFKRGELRAHGPDDPNVLNKGKAHVTTLVPHVPLDQAIAGIQADIEKGRANRRAAAKRAAAKKAAKPVPQVPEPLAIMPPPAPPASPATEA